MAATTTTSPSPRSRQHLARGEEVLPVMQLLVILLVLAATWVAVHVVYPRRKR